MIAAVDKTIAGGFGLVHHLPWRRGRLDLGADAELPSTAGLLGR